MHNDAIGMPMKVGQVIAHASTHSSNIRWGVGVIRELLEDGSIRWDLVSSKFVNQENNWERIPLFKRSTIYRTDRCIILHLLTEEDLKQKYNIAG